MVQNLMNQKLSYIIFILTLLLLTKMSVVYAVEKEAGNAATLTSVATESSLMQPKRDIRVEKLRAYLEKVNSPLLPHTEEFIRQADANALDWRLVASIAGLESTYGKFIPTDSYNAWGWGVFTGQSYGATFQDWNEGIKIVSEGIRKNYVEDGLTTVDAMAGRYAASQTWAPRVKFIMEQVDATEVPASSKQIAINL